MTASAFLRGAAILTAAGLISKLLGAIYRIPFFRVVGPEGMGLYQMAYPLYTMLLAISSAGIPIAVSKLISENLAHRDFVGINKVFRISLIFITLVSGITSIVLMQSAHYLSEHVLHDARAYYSIAAIAPAVFFVGVISVFRGYFQGFQEMVPTAISQVIEQLARVVTVLVGAYVCLPQGVEFAAAAATFGAVTGSAAAAAFLGGLCFLKPYYSITPVGSISGFAGKSQSTLHILRRIIALALPISLGGLVMPVMQTLDALTVPGRLQLAGYSVQRATQLYGEFSGGAVTLINLPTVLTISLAASLVPAISGYLECANYRDIQRQTESAMKITVIVCLPAAVGLAVLAVPISDLLYDCPEAGLPLAFVAPAALFLGLHQTSAGILMGMGKTILPVFNLLLGAFIKLTCNYVLTAMPSVGITGAALGTVLGFLVSSYLNVVFIRRFNGWTPDYRSLLLRPAFAATIMAVVVYFSDSQLRLILGGSWATTISIVVGAAVYLGALATTGILRELGFPSLMYLLSGFRRR